MGGIGMVTVLVDSYDPAIRFFADVLGFGLIEDTPTRTAGGRPKRWVVMAPPGDGAAVLLAQADGTQQRRRLGSQCGDRVGFFLRVDDFDAAYRRLADEPHARISQPRDEPYGKVAVFTDIAGNRWDLLGPVPSGEDGFSSRFTVAASRSECWARLLDRPDGAAGHYRLPGFGGTVTVTAQDSGSRLEAVKDSDPCGDTTIVVTLADAGTAATSVRVSQSRFGERFEEMSHILAVGWDDIVADFRTYLATGVEGRRHLLAWGDLGAGARPGNGGVVIEDVTDGGLAARCGLEDGDLLLTLASAPVATMADLTTILRVLGADPVAPSATWVRDGQHMTTPAPT